MSNPKPKDRPEPLGDRWSAIFVRRAAAGATLPPGIEKRLPVEWLEAVTLAEQDGVRGIEDWLRAIESRCRDDPDRVEAIRAALDGAKDDPGGEPGDEPSGGKPSTEGRDATGEDWPTPRFAAMPEVEGFPVEHLPLPASLFARAAAESIGCPIDLVAACMVVVAGAAIGRSVSLRLKSDYFASAALYLMLVGGPSSGKSPALDAVVRPMWKLDEDLHDEFRREKKAYLVSVGKVPISSGLGTEKR